MYENELGGSTWVGREVGWCRRYQVMNWWGFWWQLSPSGSYLSLQSFLQNNLMGSTNWIAAPDPLPFRCLATGFEDVGERWGGREGSPALPA